MTLTSDYVAMPTCPGCGLGLNARIDWEVVLAHSGGVMGCCNTRLDDEAVGVLVAHVNLARQMGHGHDPRPFGPSAKLPVAARKGHG